MQLQLGIVSLQSPHFDYTGFFKKTEPQRIILNIVRILQHPTDCAHNIYQVVALIVNSINLSAGGRELSLQAKLDHIFDCFRVRLITDFKNVVLCDLFVEACCCRLKVI